MGHELCVQESQQIPAKEIFGERPLGLGECDSARGGRGVTRWCVDVTCDVPGLFMPSGHNEDGSTSRVREYTEDLYFAGPGVLKLHTSDLQDWQWDYAIQDLYQHDWVYVPATRDIKCRRDLLNSHTFTRTYVYPRVDFFCVLCRKKML